MEFASVNSLADHINELDNKTALSELLATFVYLKAEHFFVNSELDSQLSDLLGSENTYKNKLAPGSRD